MSPQEIDLQSNWDAIVIGGGLGGLSTAAFLATNGLKTLVLEQYNVVGGCSHVFRRKKKWEFDVGIHYIGDCGEYGQVPKILKSLGLKDRVEFELMDPEGYDTIVTPNHKIKIPYGWDNYLNNLIEAFPKEEKGLRKFVKIISTLGKAVDRSNTPASLKGYAKFGIDAGLASAWAMVPVSKLLDYCNLSSEARTVVTVQSGQYGCPPSRAPVIVHAGLLQNYIEGGAWYPKGGGQVFSANLVEVIQAYGGVVRTQTKVDKILLSKGVVQGVRLDGGQEFLSKYVISAADLKKTYLDMVGVENLPNRFVKKVKNYKMSSPFVNVYLGVDVDLKTWMPKTNYFSIPTTTSLDSISAVLEQENSHLSPEKWMEKANEILPAFIHSGSVNDPEYKGHAPEGCSTLEAMTIVPTDRNFWTKVNAGHNYSKDSFYQGVKANFVDMMIDRTEAVLPGIKQHIVWKEASTPLSHERYTLSSDATAYGLECNVKQFGPLRPKSKTIISGLFIAGTSTAWGPSIEGVFLSGLHAASAILGRDLDHEIRQGTIYADSVKLPERNKDWDALKVSSQLGEKHQQSKELILVQ